MQESLTPRSLDWLRCVLPIALFDSAVTQSHRVVRLCYSAVSFPLRNLTPWCPSHCGIWLLGVLPTAESDSSVSFPLRNLTPRCPSHCGICHWCPLNLPPQDHSHCGIWLHRRDRLCSVLSTAEFDSLPTIEFDSVVSCPPRGLLGWAMCRI